MNKMLLAVALLSSASLVASPRDIPACNVEEEEEVMRCIMIEEDTPAQEAAVDKSAKCDCTCVDCKCTLENKCSENCNCFEAGCNKNILPTVTVSADDTN